MLINQCNYVRIRRLIVSNLIRMIKSYVFWIVIVLMFILMGSSSLYAVSQSKTISIFETVLKMSKQSMIETNEDLSNINVYQMGFGISYKYFYPLVCTIPYLVLNKNESVDRYILYKKIRVSRKEIEIVNFWTSVFLAALVLIISDIVFGIYVYICFPNSAVFPNEVLIPHDKVVVIVVKNVFKLAVAGSFWGSIVYFLREIIANIYLVASFPFLFKYIWSSLFVRLSSGSRLTDKQLRIFYMFNDNAVYSIFDTGLDGMIVLGEIILFELCIFSITSHYIKWRFENKYE